MTQTTTTWIGLSAAAVLLTAGGTASAQTGEVTFSRDVAPILQQSCQGCHRTGQMGPMSLMTFEEVRPWARAIRSKVVERVMPPWHLDKTVGIQEFENDLSLTDDEIDTIARWVDAGAPRGNPADLPPPVDWPDDNVWHMAERYGREPDLIVSSTPWTQRRRGAGPVVAADRRDRAHRRSVGHRHRGPAGAAGASHHPITRSSTCSRRSSRATTSRSSTCRAAAAT